MKHINVVRPIDRRKGIIITIIFLLVMLFLLFFIKYRIPDPPKITIPIPITLGEAGITEFQLHNSGGSSASNSEEVHQTTPENPTDQATQDESVVTVPDGTNENESNATNESSETTTTTNYFSGDGTGGNNSNGSGGGFGNDTGDGSGSGVSGQGGNGNRKVTAHIKTKPKTSNNTRCKIVFELTVDSNGNVLRVDVDWDKTNSNNSELIAEVTGLVKKEVKFEKNTNAMNVKLDYTVIVQPNQ